MRAAGGETPIGQGAGVWRLKSNGQATNVAFVTNVLCEGALTLTNDSSRYGPWAGKIIFGSEVNTSGRNLVFAVDTNSVLTSFDLGPVVADSIGLITNSVDLSCEHFDAIQTNHLYVLTDATDCVLKVSPALLTNFVGDLLITQGGLNTQAEGEPELFIAHWNGSRFVVYGIPLGFYSKDTFSSVELEGACFAPIAIPALP